MNSFVPEQETTCCLVCYEDMTNDIVTHCVPPSSSASTSGSATPHTPHAICGSCLGAHVAGLVSEHKIGEEPRILCVVPDCDAFYSEVFLKRA